MRIYPAPPIEIDRSEVLRYLGSKPEDTLCADIARLGDRLLHTAKPAACAALFPLRFEGGSPVLEGPDIALSGRAIARHFAGCRSSVLLCATLGFETDRLIQALGQTNAYEALVTDACATAAIESLCDRATGRLQEEGFLPEGAGVTSRFSPGYGDLPLELQQRLLDAADARRAIGLSVNASLMLTPTKSVTALIGVGRDGRCASGAKGCASCSMNKTCPYRRGLLG